MKNRLSTLYGKTKIYTAQSEKPTAERVLVVPGYSEAISHNKKLVDALASQGFDATTFSQPRRAGKDDDPMRRQGKVVLSILESSLPKGEKVHALAHSLGSAAVLKAAQEAPDLFESITIMEPIGMVGAQDFSELGGRVGKKVGKNLLGSLRAQSPARRSNEGYAASVDRESSLRYFGRVALAQLAGSGVIGKQPALALEEALAVGRYGIADDVAKVTELGIPVHIVAARNDEMFDYDKVMAGYEANIHTATSVSSVADAGARHDTFWMQPERTARIFRQLIHRS